MPARRVAGGESVEGVASRPSKVSKHSHSSTPSHDQLADVLASLRSPDVDTVTAALKTSRHWFDNSAGSDAIGGSGQMLKLLIRFQKTGVLFEAWDQHSSSSASSKAVLHVLYLLRTQLHMCLAAAPKKSSADRKLFLGGYSLANQLLTIRSHALFDLLNSKNDRAAEAALQLLTAVVRFGGSLARAAATQIDWNGKALSTLMTSRLRLQLGPRDSRKPKAQKQQTEPVRTALIRFTLAIIESGSAEQDVLDVFLLGKTFLPAMWTHIAQDSVPLVNEVLQTLKTVVLDRGDHISPVVKRRIFNSHTITQIASLYTTGSRDVAHKFLCALFASPSQGFRCLIKNGTCSGGLAGGENNSGTMNLLTSLQADRYERPRSLLLCILQACPQLQGPYIASFPFSLDPQLTLQWVEHASLLCHVLRVQWYPAATEFSPNTEERLDRLVRWSVPRSLTQSVLSKSLQHSSRLVGFHTLLVIGALLERLLRVSTALDSAVAGMQNLFPSIQVYVALLQRELNEANTGGSLLFSALIRVVHMYEIVWPGTLLDAEVDVGKYMYAEGGLSNMPIDMAGAMLELLGHTDQNIEWWKRKQSRGSLSRFGELLMVLSEPSLSAKAFALAKRLLISTGLFDGCEIEATCWLQPLCSLSHVQSEKRADMRAMAEFLDAILQQAKQKNIALNDEIARIIRFSCKGNLSANFTGQFSVVVLAALQRLNGGKQPNAEHWASAAISERRYASSAILAILQSKI
eukprot:SAG31_NODE_5401_length_2557_cov_8.991050_1_plen_744_part_10